MSRPPRIEPKPGLVIRYGYLWRDEAKRGQEEGVKDRPCAVVFATKREDDRDTVYVVPITHTPPSKSEHAIEIPAATKKRLGLDDARSWVITSELNVFTWPGYDLRPVGRPGDSRGFAYGVLPKAMTTDLVENVRKQQRKGQLPAVNRDDR